MSPKYPVVHPSPSNSLILRNLRFTDLLTIAAFGGATFVLNWFGSKFEFISFLLLFY